MTNEEKNKNVSTFLSAIIVDEWKENWKQVKKENGNLKKMQGAITWYSDNDTLYPVNLKYIVLLTGGRKVLSFRTLKAFSLQG